MAAVDLNTLSLSELKQLDRSLRKAIAEFDDRKRTEAREALEEKAKEFGFSLTELTGMAKTRKRAPASAKYRHPKNSAVTWSGRGRKPKWFEDALDAGNPRSRCSSDKGKTYALALRADAELGQ